MTANSALDARQRSQFLDDLEESLVQIAVLPPFTDATGLPKELQDAALTAWATEVRAVVQFLLRGSGNSVGLAEFEPTWSAPRDSSREWGRLFGEFSRDFSHLSRERFEPWKSAWNLTPANLTIHAGLLVDDLAEIARRMDAAQLPDAARMADIVSTARSRLHTS
jgi:hypothetical protein